MRKQSLLYRDNKIISCYHERTVHKTEEESMAVLGFRRSKKLTVDQLVCYSTKNKVVAQFHT